MINLTKSILLDLLDDILILLFFFKISYLEKKDTINNPSICLIYVLIC